MAILGKITDKVYNQMKELRNSDLAEIEISYQHYLDRSNKKRTESMEFGSAFHVFLLDGTKDFFEQYAVMEEGFNLRSNENKRKWQDVLDSGKTPLRYEDYLAIQKMAANVYKHPRAKQIMETSENEGAYTGVILGLPAKAKIDVRSRGYTFDVKTCSDASKDGFRKSINNFNYHRQGAFYEEILDQNGIKSKGYGFIAVESEEPHMVGVYVLGPDSMAKGMTQVNRLVAKLKKHQADEKLWPGYCGDIEEVEISFWKSKEEEDHQDNHVGA